MLFKTKFTAAFLFCLGVAAQKNAVDAQSTEVAPEADSGIIGDVIWPVAFNDMCQTLLAVTNNLDKQITYAKSKGYSCTPAQTTAIGPPGKCNPLTLVIDKDMIREILDTIDLPRTEVIHRAFDYEGQQNMFSARDKNFHKSRRRYISPVFSLKHLRSLEPTLHERTQSLLQKIDEIIGDPSVVKHGPVLQKGHIDVGYLSVCFSVDSIGELAFGRTFDMLKDGTHEVPELVAKTLKGCALNHFAPWLKYVLPPPDFSFFEFIYEKIAERNGVNPDGKPDVLHHLLNAKQKELEKGNGQTGNEYEDMVTGKLTNKAIATECAVFLAAGSDTTASIMGYTLLFLAKYPTKLARLQEELDFVHATNDEGSLPSYTQVRPLPYLNACINEALRLHPIVPTGIPRQVNEDMTIGGYFFAKGTANYPQLHWADEYFPQAHKFIPERWLPSESPFPPIMDKVFFPFSAGGSNCVGKDFAMMSLRLGLAALALNYNMERVSPACDNDILEAVPGPDEGTCVVRMERRKRTPYITRTDSGTSMTSI
ncbi:hypothetical protein BGZ70_002229 [Mortierella alpina]|uniref:Cytochrome P450 n=1 Tax=Mortierella alpina TaxID=64518 RepID=A0A9P6IUF7_MORAP|nr:hypothetical protein BGZ70_002229 [Mortierella alpina]